MESDENHHHPPSPSPSSATRLFPSLAPMLLISMGYIDPGKWSAVVEGGARYGTTLLFPIFAFNCVAILCQYLAASIAVVTHKNLAQICTEEYTKPTCIFLAIQAQLSVIVLDLTMILGIAHGLNLILGLNLYICLLFTATDVVLFPLFASLLEKRKAEVVFVSIAGLVLVSYVFGVLLSHPTVDATQLSTRLNRESLFTLMSLLGANIMPHNFYVHSSIIQRQKGPTNASKRALCHDHLFGILCVFSSLYLVNYVVMNSAATVFHSAGLVVLTFQDILVLMDQVFRNPVAIFVLFLVMFISSHITSLTWNLGGQVVLHELLRMDPPAWIHRAAIRMLVIFLSLYWTWNFGPERIYQMLVFSQVILAMLLPSSVIPLFRVASSRPIMGVHKISHLVELLAWTTLIVMLCLNSIFVIEMLFGQSDWVTEFWWNVGNRMSLPYIVLLITAFASLAFTLLLIATPLKSATLREDMQIWNWELQRTVPESFADDETDINESKHTEGEPVKPESALEKSVYASSDNLVVESNIDLPEVVRKSDQVFHLPLVEESVTGQLEATTSMDLVAGGVVDKELVDAVLRQDDTLQEIESVVPVGKVVKVEVDSRIEKDEDLGDVWEPEEPYQEVSGPTSTSDGPGSFRSLSGKSDEGGNGPGSLSRMSGLGRAARRQLAAILDEFWGQLYDFHGQATREASLKQLDVLFGLDFKPTIPSLKVNPPAVVSSGYFPSVAERGPTLPLISNLYDSPNQQRIASGVDSLYGYQTGSSLWSADMPYVDGYVQNLSGTRDSGERRYSSLRLPASSEGWDYQPATVHGHQLASYLTRITTDRRSDSLNTLLDSSTPKSPSFVPPSYRDPLTYALGQSRQSRVSTINTSSMHNPMVSRNSRLPAEKPYYDPCSYGSGENVGSPVITKKYHSLPDVSGLAVPRRDSHLVNQSSRWNGPPGFGPSASKTVYESLQYPNAGSRPGVPSPYDELSSSKMNRDVFPMQPSMNADAKSLWSRQPFEQLFGVAGKYQGLADEMGSEPNFVLPISNSRVGAETELLKSFQYCIMKLLKLEGCDWLFKQNGGADEDLIDQVAASEKFLYEAKTDINHVTHFGGSQLFSSDKKYGSASKTQDADLAKFLGSSVSYCGEGCIWQIDLILSFGVWCIHRILELSLMESRPELWGKYTYVLNRLQGILDPALSKPRSPLSPCFCLQMPIENIRKSSPPPVNGLLPPTARPGKGKRTTASTLLEIIKDVEIAVSCRKGRTGTAAGDVAFPKGKENLASVLKRYKRRLSYKPIGTHDGGSGSRKVSPAPTYV